MKVIIYPFAYNKVLRFIFQLPQRSPKLLIDHRTLHLNLRNLSINERPQPLPIKPQFLAPLESMISSVWCRQNCGVAEICLCIMPFPSFTFTCPSFSLAGSTHPAAILQKSIIAPSRVPLFPFGLPLMWLARSFCSSQPLQGPELSQIMLYQLPSPWHSIRHLLLHVVNLSLSLLWKRICNSKEHPQVHGSPAALERCPLDLTTRFQLTPASCSPSAQR